MPHEPIVLVQLQIDQFPIIQPGQVEVAHRFGLAVGNFVNPPARAVRAIIVMAFPEVIPIADKNAAVAAPKNPFFLLVVTSILDKYSALTF